MGTLTGNTPELPEHCPHKLPTSCRLTATPACCACQDRRPHAAAYSTYVDGIGMTMRGTRWQRYCWFCREFWENRVRATDPPMLASETRVPEVPDQAEFLEKWFDFHRGYRLEISGAVSNAGSANRIQGSGHTETEAEQDGRELGGRRMPVTLEVPWRETAPGRLPLHGDNRDSRVTTSWQRPSAEGEGQVPQVSLEETLDDMLAAADEEQNNRASYLRNQPPTASRENPIRLPTSPHAQVQQPVESRRVRPMQSELANTAQATTEELETLRSELTTLTSEREVEVGQRDELDSSINTLTEQRDEVESRIQALDTRIDQSNQRARALERNMRALRNMNRVFGSREEIERQGPDYVSPLTSMFTRAYERFRIAEEVRAEERASMRNTERNRVLLQNTWSQRQFPFEAARRAREQSMSESVSPTSQPATLQPAHGLANANNNSTDTTTNTPAHQTANNMVTNSDTRIPSLDDIAVPRPPPQSDTDMTIKLACKICLQQTADTAVLPCGHLVMCAFCADAWVPSRRGPGADETMVVGRAKCPLCRRAVRRKVRIYTG